MKVAGRALAVLLLLATVGCDRVTKHLAAVNLIDMPSQSHFANIVRLEYTENTGAFLSVGSGFPEWVQVGLFRIGVGLALAAIAFVALKHRWSGLLLAGASLVFAGGISNLFDRLLHGRVIDFMSLGLGPLRTGIFNVADLAILAGGALVVIGSTKPSLKNSQRSV